MSSSKSIYKLHKETKEIVINSYFEDSKLSINPNFFSEIKVNKFISKKINNCFQRLIKEEHEIFKTKFLNQSEIQLERNFNELYSKHIGLKSDDDLESLLAKWKSLEEEFLLSSKDFDPSIKFSILHKSKTLRLSDNLRKLVKNSENRENLSELKESLKKDFERSLVEYKVN